MNLEQFRHEVHAEFGPHLEHATPEHVRKFLCRIQAEIASGKATKAGFDISQEHAKNYEQIVTEFFARVIDFPTEQAVIHLWIFAAEMYFSQLGEQYAELSAMLSFDVSE
ncbi:MAG: hypothetical protein ACYDBB_10130 [Armatimonadota bacterium]